MNNGWIKLHRKFLDWEWYQEPHMVHLFLHLLLSANHENKEWKGMVIERGELVTGLLSLSEDTGISIRSLRTCIDRLKSTGEITSKSTNKFRVITIIKWDSYQLTENKTDSQSDNQDDKPATSQRQASDNKQEGKELKEGKKGNNIFTPPTVREVDSYCLERGNSISAQLFVDHYEARGWMIGKNKMKDWKAAVRTWEQNEFNKSTTLAPAPRSPEIYKRIDPPEKTAISPEVREELRKKGINI